MKERSPLKKRASEARANAAAAKAWATGVASATAGTQWRPTSSWIELADGTRCAELTHVSTGKVRGIRLSQAETIESVRALVIGEAGR
jgi:hypothetical protein